MSVSPSTRQVHIVLFLPGVMHVASNGVGGINGGLYHLRVRPGVGKARFEVDAEHLLRRSMMGK